MPWMVESHENFVLEFATLPREVQIALVAVADLLREFGPQLGRPHVDTLKGSRHANMKEMRFGAADGVWRVAFAFDPTRRGIILVAGDKAGVSESRFYKRLIAVADARYDSHLQLPGRARRH